MAERPRQTLTDYVTLAIGPSLIMALVGSLIYFLVEVLYAGAYGPEMRWMLFFFVFGIVLIARIAVTNAIAGRAGIYGAVLCLLVWIGMMKYVTYSEDSPVGPWRALINAGLVILAWWCVQRLVRDCTHIDDKTAVDSRGLLQAAGLEELDPRAEERRRATEASRTKASRTEASREGERPEDPTKEPHTWWERWQLYREEQKKRRTPGITVVWFSLAALPLFGLGQSLIPVEAAERRRYVFWLMAVYLGSGLGLLLTTSFLGLRRYLNQRGLRMPRAMTAVWLSVGGGFVLVLLLLGALLPRPAAEYRLFDLAQADSKDAEASRHALKGDKAGKGEGKAGGDQNGKEEGNKDKETSSASKDSGPGKAQGKGTAKGGKTGEAKSGEKSKDGEADEQKTESPPPMQGVSEMLRNLATVLKWVVFGLIALVVLLLVLRSGLRWLANFFQWARNLLEALRNFWASLFAGWTSAETSAAAAEREEKALPPRPFSMFANPFSDGSAPRRSPRELVRYTFAALEAWARDQALGRADGETPREFAERIGMEVPAVEDEVLRLADLFARAAYAPGELPAAALKDLRPVWERLTETARTPAALGEPVA